MKFILFVTITLASLSSFANCDISGEETTAEKYRFVLNADVSKPYAKYVKVGDRKNLPKATLTCLSEVDIALEMGDGYYDVRSVKLYAINYPNSTRLAGYVELYKLYYTEDNEIVDAEVRYNSRGQRLTPAQ